MIKISLPSACLDRANIPYPQIVFLSLLSWDLELQYEISTLEMRIGFRQDYHTNYQEKLSLSALILTHERGQWSSGVEGVLGSRGSMVSETSCPPSDFSF